MPLPPSIADNTVSLPQLAGWPPANTYYGYCSIAQVKQEWPSGFLAEMTTLDATSIAQGITYTANEMQDALARYYTMPYVGTDNGVKLTLQQINALLAVAYLIERYFQGGESNVSAAGAERRAMAEAILLDIQSGRIMWGSPFNDAVVQSEKPIYPLSAGATILPDPNSTDPMQANPVFTMGRTQVRRDGIM